MGNKVKKIFMRRRVPRLPDAYQEVDYIESSGTQYIDTGYIPNYNTEISCKFMHTEHVIDTPVFGTRNSSSQREYVLWSHPTEYASNTVGTKFNSTEKQNITSYPQGTDITFHYDRTGWQYGDYSGTWSPSSGSPSYNLIVMGLQNAGSVDSRKFAGRLYYFQIGESGALVRDFVPCYRKSDNVIGLYDLANDQFYTNSGSGSFTKGTDSSTIELKEFQVWPDDQRQLRDETDMANSTTGSSGVIASTNGKFIRPSYSFGGGNGAYSKGTIDGYDVLVASSQHGNVHIGLSDANYTDLMSHKKVKIVRDYFNLGANQSNYTNGIWFGGNESLTDTSSSSTITVGSNWSGMSFSYSTGYSMEQVINTSDMSCTTTITNLSNQAKSTFTYTKVFSRETNSTYIINGGGNRFIWMNDDYGGGPVRAGNIHVYYTD